MRAKKRLSNISGLEELIKGELSRGSSIEEIKSHLIEQGYEESLVDRKTNAYFIKNYLIKSMFVISLLALLPALLLISPSIVGYASAGQSNKYPLSERYMLPLVFMFIVAIVYLMSRKKPDAAHNHIKEHIKKGYSLGSIKKELKVLGYKEKHIEKLIKGYLIKHHFAKPILLSIIPLILLISLIFMQPTINGNSVIENGAPCDTKWVCTNWDPPKCPPTGIQTRECTEIDNCGKISKKPAESRKCVHIAEYVKAVEEKVTLILPEKTPKEIENKEVPSKNTADEYKMQNVVGYGAAREGAAPRRYMIYQIMLVIIVLFLTTALFGYENRGNFIASNLNKDLMQLEVLPKEYVPEAKELYSRIMQRYMKLVKTPVDKSKMMTIYNRINESYFRLAGQIKSYEISQQNRLGYCTRLITEINANIQKNKIKKAVDLYMRLYKGYIELKGQNIEGIEGLYNAVLQVYNTLGKPNKKL